MRPNHPPSSIVFLRKAGARAWSLPLTLALAAGACTPRPESEAGGEPSAQAGPGREVPSQPARPGRSEKPGRLQGAFPSPEALATAVLAALKNRDAAVLNELRVSEREYKEHLWPEFPQASDPKHTLTVDFHWQHLNAISLAGIQKAIGNYGGVVLELLDVVPGGGVEEYASYKLLRRVRLRVRQPSGDDGFIEVFGSIVGMDGEYKILGFPD